MCLSAPTLLLLFLISTEEVTAEQRGLTGSFSVLLCFLELKLWCGRVSVKHLALLITLARTSGVSGACGGWRRINDSSETEFSSFSLVVYLHLYRFKIPPDKAALDPCRDPRSRQAWCLLPICSVFTFTTRKCSRDPPPDNGVGGV